MAAGGAAMEVDDRGPAGAPEVWLIMGLVTPLAHWPEPGVAALPVRPDPCVTAAGLGSAWVQNLHPAVDR